MKKIKIFFKIGFYSANIILITLYLFPGSILGWFLYNDHLIQLQITRDFFISSNHFYAFIFLSILGILAYYNSNKINILIKYLFLISIILELTHIIISERGFELRDLLGNVLGVVFVIGIYKFKKRYVSN